MRGSAHSRRSCSQSSQPRIYAQTAVTTIDRLRTCSQFEGMERLECVDDLLGEKLEKPDPAQFLPGSNWIISETTSPVDYHPQITALTKARPSSQDAPPRSSSVVVPVAQS